MYCTEADVQLVAGGEDRLRELSDLESIGEVNDFSVAAAISAADAWIDSYAQRRHSVPFSPVPATIKNLSAEETVYRLKMRRHMVSEHDKEQHEERLVWLRDLAKGLVSPGTDPISPKSTAVVPEAMDRPSTEDVSRDSLKGFA